MAPRAGASSAHFLEYEPPEAAAWLAAAIEAAYTAPPTTRRDRIPINATVPAVTAAQVPDVLARFPGARTAKVKVAEPGQTLADDVARVNAVREQVPTVRVDANGGWSVAEAVEAARALTADGPLEYLEQPCATVPELAELRRAVDVPIAADESIRKADDPLHVVRSGAADVAVLKVAPLGGVATLLEIARQIDIPIVVSSALDSAVGIGRGLLAAGALPDLRHACGLGTGGLFVEDVAEPLTPVDGYLPVVGRHSGSGSARRRWPRPPNAGSGGSTGSRPATRQGAQTSWPNSRNGHSAVVAPNAAKSEPAGMRVSKWLSILATSSALKNVHTMPMTR